MEPWALQQAVFARLSAYAPLTSLVSAVYDNVPDDAFDAPPGGSTPAPYVVIGDDTSIPFDTDDSIGSEATIVIHAWSRYRGRKEVKQIQRAVYNALHRHALSVTGAHTVTCEFETADSVLDPDGVTRHGTITFRIILERE